jgi:hypothetical protein
LQRFLHIRFILTSGVSAVRFLGCGLHWGEPND